MRRANPAFTDDLIADVYTVAANGVSRGKDPVAVDWFPEAMMEAIEYVLHEGIAFPEDFDYATTAPEVEGECGVSHTLREDTV